MEKNRLTRSQIALVGMVVVGGAVVLTPRHTLYELGEKYAPAFELFQPFEANRRNTCQSSFKNSGLALAQYTADFNVYPPVRNAVTSAGWAEILQPYSRKGYKTFACPSTPFFPKLIFAQNALFPIKYTALWMNARMGAINPQAIGAPAQKLLLGEGDYTADTGYSKSQIPPAWLSERHSPSYRHLGGANYLMADGHTRWMRPSEVKQMEARSSLFAPN